MVGNDNFKGKRRHHIVYVAVHLPISTAKHSMRLVHFARIYTINYPNVGKHTIKLSVYSVYISPSCRLKIAMDMDMDGLSHDPGLITNS